MRKLCALLLVTGYSLLINFPASASYISLKTKVSSKVVGNMLKVTVSAVNKGDEAAHNVQAEIRVGIRTVAARKHMELGVNEVYRVQADFQLGRKDPGEYPLIVTMHYSDANMYPFSALTCQTYAFGVDNLPSEIFGSLKQTSFWKQGRIKLVLKNLDSGAVVASTYLVVPRELSVRGEPYIMTVPSKSSASRVFELENFSALGGSTYQVYAVSEYEKDNKHCTAITPGLVRIVESQSFLGINYIYLLAGLVVLTVIFILYQLGASFFKKK